MKQEEQKQAVAKAAMEYVYPHLNRDMVIGIGTGSTANCFIDLLAHCKHDFQGAVASSEMSAERLKEQGIEVYELNSQISLPFYIDGADEMTKHRHLIKGGGAALTREKIVAAASKEFICIADQSKWVDVLGVFPLPVEVIPMARSFVARELVKLGGSPEYREGVVTDNGNVILDVWHLSITDPIVMENAINQIPGVVMNGIFAQRPADILFIASEEGIRKVTA